MSVADLRALYGRRRAECRILLDQQLLAEHAALEDDYARVISSQATTAGSIAAPAEASDIARRLEEIEERIAEVEIVLVVENIGTQRWLELKAKHPPTREQRLAGIQTNHQTFAPAAVAACTVEFRDPQRPDLEMSAELADFLFEILPENEFERVFAPIVDLNLGSDGRPKSLIVSVNRRLNGGSLATAPSTGSPGPSSSDGLSDPATRTG